MSSSPSTSDPYCSVRVMSLNGPTFAGEMFSLSKQPVSTPIPGIDRMLSCS